MNISLLHMQLEIIACTFLLLYTKEELRFQKKEVNSGVRTDEWMQMVPNFVRIQSDFKHVKPEIQGQENIIQ